MIDNPGKNHSFTKVVPTGLDVSRSSQVITATFVFALGLCLLSIVGYAQASHDVAHDARHTFSFPCH